MPHTKSRLSIVIFGFTGLLLSGCVSPTATSSIRSSKGLQRPDSKKTSTQTLAYTPLRPPACPESAPPLVSQRVSTSSLRCQSRQQEPLDAMFVRFGKHVAQYADYLRLRACYLRQVCPQNQRQRVCRHYRMAQRMFHLSKRSSRSMYRGYLPKPGRLLWTLPRTFREQYRKHRRRLYHTDPKEPCWIEKGFPSNCMSYAQCATKGALATFRGPWGQGLHMLPWGLINKWTTRAYLRRLHRRFRTGANRHPHRWAQRMRRHLQRQNPWQRKQTARKWAMELYRLYQRQRGRESLYDKRAFAPTLWLE